MNNINNMIETFLGYRLLKYLNEPSILSCRRVDHKWHDVFSHDHIIKKALAQKVFFESIYTGDEYSLIHNIPLLRQIKHVKWSNFKSRLFKGAKNIAFTPNEMFVLFQNAKENPLIIDHQGNTKRLEFSSALTHWKNDVILSNLNGNLINKNEEFARLFKGKALISNLTAIDNKIIGLLRTREEKVALFSYEPTKQLQIQDIDSTNITMFKSVEDKIWLQEAKKDLLIYDKNLNLLEKIQIDTELTHLTCVDKRLIGYNKQLNSLVKIEKLDQNWVKTKIFEDPLEKLDNILSLGSIGSYLIFCNEHEVRIVHGNYHLRCELDGVQNLFIDNNKFMVLTLNDLHIFELTNP